MERSVTIAKDSGGEVEERTTAPLMTNAEVASRTTMLVVNFPGAKCHHTVTISEISSLSTTRKIMCKSWAMVALGWYGAILLRRLVGTSKEPLYFLIDAV